MKMDVTLETSCEFDTGATVCAITLPSSVDDSAYIADITLPDSSGYSVAETSIGELFAPFAPRSLHHQPSCSTPKKAGNMSQPAILESSLDDKAAFVADITLPDSDCSGTTAQIDSTLQQQTQAIDNETMLSTATLHASDSTAASGEISMHAP